MPSFPLPFLRCVVGGSALPFEGCAKKEILSHLCDYMCFIYDMSKKLFRKPFKVFGLVQQIARFLLKDDVATILVKLVVLCILVLIQLSELYTIVRLVT